MRINKPRKLVDFQVGKKREIPESLLKEEVKPQHTEGERVTQ